MRAYLHIVQNRTHQREIMLSLSRGLRRHGIKTFVGDDPDQAKNADFYVAWGERLPFNSGKPRLILEAGYINGHSGDYHRDRLQFVSTGWNGLHGRADAGASGCPPDRWDALGIELQPWRIEGDVVLVCGQHPGDMAAPPQKDLERVIDDLTVMGHVVLYRPHPLLAPNLVPLRESLQRAYTMVTWSSTSAVESVIMGVPTVTLDEGTMAWEVTSHGLTAERFMGDRSQWAYNLAYRQWTQDELENGLAWEHLRHGCRHEAPQADAANAH